MARAPKKITKPVESAGLKKLRAWLAKNEYSPTVGASKIGVSRQTFHKWLHGGRLERTSAMLIEKSIGIPAEDFFN